MLAPLALMLVVSPDAQAFAACRSAPARSGACIESHGILSAGNGAFSSRLGIGNGTVYAIHQPGQAQPDEYAPAKAASVLRRSPSLFEAEGDYRVCPLRPPPQAEAYLAQHDLLTGCLAGASHIVARRRLP